MARARQTRRLARTWAEILGTTSGVADAEDFAMGVSGEGRTAQELRDVSRPGSWDEGAINAGCANLDGCPAGFEDAYYEAYDRAACERARELADAA
jgi:hypothetical protein